MLEHDRYAENRFLYIVSIMSLIVSIALVIFAFYCVPFFLFGWFYSIPSFVFFIQAELAYVLEISDIMAAWVVLFAILLLGILFGMIAYACSRQIEQRLIEPGIKPLPSELEIEDSEFEASRNIESTGLMLKVFIYMALALVILFFIEWLITGPPPG